MAHKLTGVQRLCAFAEASIANGASLSASFNLNGRVLCGVYMPAAWTAAGLTFQVSHDGTTWYNVQSATAEYSATATVDQYIALDPVIFYGAAFLKVRSGTAGSAVNQGAARTLILACAVPSTDQ